MAATLYTARQTGPEIIEAGVANPLVLSVYRDGALVTVASGTISIWNASNVTVVSAAATTQTSAGATYSLLAATIASETYSDGWRFEWALTIAGEVHTFRRDGSLVYRRLYPVITDVDLLRAHTDLARRMPPTERSYQDYLDESWARVEAKLINTGRRPFLIMAPSALRDYHMADTLAGVFRDFATGGPGTAEWAMMEKYEGLAKDAWAELTFPQADVGGTASAANKRTGGASTVWLGGAPYAYPRRY